MLKKKLKIYFVDLYHSHINRILKIRYTFYT